jgi:type 2 lantibiotic biosynthesis protein LanM
MAAAQPDHQDRRESIVTMSDSAGLKHRLLLEGWSLHQRLQVAPPLLGDGDGLSHWRAVVAPDNPANFEKRLSWDGLSPASAAWALNPPDHLVPTQPDWWETLLKLCSAAGKPVAATQLEGRGCQLPFVQVWRPAASWALMALQERCADLSPVLQLADDAWLDLAEALLERLCTTADQALLELFNQRRTPGTMLLAHLGNNSDGSGEPVHEAYDTFVEELLASDYGLLLAEFPVLGRLLAVVTKLWLESSEELLRRLADSRSELLNTFAIGVDAPVHSVQLGLSDPHRGGRAVAILDFKDKQHSTRVVYKPKDMQVDHAYQEFLEILNKESVLSPLRSLRVVNFPGYGFMEWVEHRLCNSDTELAEFYTNAGRTMAVLHLLGCTDCHHENLIASGDQLVLIDTETLLEADLRDLISDDGDNPDSVSPLRRSMQASVLRSGLLPQWLLAGAGRKVAFDISALGIQPPPQERESPGWLGVNSDGMMAGRLMQACELPTSLPVGLGSRQRLTDFVEELCAGFEAQLREVIRLRPCLEAGLENFRGKPRRLVARATRLYFSILRQILEPAALCSAVAQGLKLEQLSRSFVLASKKPLNWSMFEAEIRQMERLDIPFFEHCVDGEAMPLPEGLAPIEGFMQSSGLASAKRRLAELDGTEIEFQQQLVRGAIAARHMRPITEPTVEPHGLKSDQRLTYKPEIYAAKAQQLAEEIWTSAICDRSGRPEWLGMDLGADGECFQFGLIGHSLYSGASGIALTLARIAMAQPAASATIWRERAWTCLESLADLASRNNNDQLFRFVRDQPFGLAGSGGILLTLELLKQEGFTAAETLSQQLLKQLRPDRLLADDGVDIISGVAGLIGPLLHSASLHAQDLAVVCGERLLTLQLESGGWLFGRNKSALTGFSHGAAGMAAALARLAKASGEDRFAKAAEHAVAYERSVYVAKQGNWPDFRSTSDPTHFMTSWCHGAPGILLSRLVLQGTGLADEHTGKEIETARDCTLAMLERMVTRDHDLPTNLCCGVFGLTGLLRLDAELSQQPLPEQVAQAEYCAMQRAEASGGYKFFSIENGSINLPGLFTGKAGVAFAMQEIANGPKWMGPVMSCALVGD